MIRIGLCLLSFWCWGSLAAEVALQPQTAIGLLHGAGERLVRDGDGYTYRIFSVQPKSDLQVTLVDAITERLVQTSIGYEVCHYLLNHNAQLVELHLGVSSEAARRMALGCAKPMARSKRTQIVYNDPDRQPQRISANGALIPRRYVIVVTNRPDMALDSWTDSFSNQTTLFLHHSAGSSDLNLRHLIQALAHEMAIYFDAKSWPWGPDWERIPEFSKLEILGARVNDVSMAAVNPAIGAVLAFVRAYKIERQMLKEMVANGRLGPEPLFYSAAELPFLHLNCQGPCLKNFILEQLSWLDPLHRSLLAFTPHYRARRLEYEIARSQRANVALKEEYSEVLQRWPVAYLQHIQDKGFTLESILIPSPDDLLARQLSSQLMVSSLIPQDLAILEKAQVRTPSRAINDLLTFLSVPLLSDAASALSYGPRPRIRTGGTK